MIVRDVERQLAERAWAAAHGRSVGDFWAQLAASFELADRDHPPTEIHHLVGNWSYNLDESLARLESPSVAP